MHFDQILHAFRTKPTFQRLVMAFALGLFVSCAASADGGHADAASTTGIEAAN